MSEVRIAFVCCVWGSDHSSQVGEIVLHVLDLLLVLRKVLLQTLVFLGERLVVSRLGRLGRVRRLRRLLQPTTHLLIVIDVLLQA